MAESDTCHVCADKYTNVLRKEIKCNYCSFSACVKCMKQQFLTIIQDPNCMNCHVEFNREFLDMNFPKSFIKDELRKHRENILCEREKSLLPGTLKYVERERQRRQNQILMNELKKEKVKAMEPVILVNKEMDEVTSTYFTLINGDNRIATTSTYSNTIKELRKQKKELMIPVNDIVASIREIRENAQYQHLHDGEDTTTPKKFIKACVVHGCRGFLSTRYKCGLCDTWVCPNCHEIKTCQNDDNHVCKTENIESVKLISKETKPCPKCASAIYKTDGCSQMFCVECHTVFSWKTGKEIITKVIHNPHYYEWVRRNNNGVVPRNPHDIPGGNYCNGLPDVIQLYNLYGNASKELRKIMRFLRCLYQLRDYNIIPINEENDINELNRDLRIKYLLNDIDENEWKKLLQQREKQRDFKKEQSKVYEMLVQISQDELNRFTQSRLNIHEQFEIMKKMEAIILYYNESITNVFKRFNSKTFKNIISINNWGFEQ
jgi:hypothetical protein